MNLIKKKWTNKDKVIFLNYLEENKNNDKVEWTKKIVNTNMEVLAIKIPKLRLIAKEIHKGNYYSFLDLNINEYYECTIINAILITSINDFNVMKNYLDKYVKNIDNWSSTDILKFNIKSKEMYFYNLAKEYINSDLPFKRRVGIIILFNFITDENYIDKIFSLVKEDDNYYVNMAYSWLLCECYIKNKEKTIEFIKKNRLSKFVMNKFISKCKDSFRVSDDDKKMLEKYRI